LVAASDVAVGVARPVTTAPVIVPPLMVAVEVKVPDMVAPFIIGVVKVLDASV
jgi:hypothetical protein